MTSPEDLDTVDWSALEHAYGSTEDLPDLIRALYSPDLEVLDEAGYEVANRVNHQGSLYSATVEVIPFLAHAALHMAAQREDVVTFLIRLAERDSSDDPVGDPLAGLVRAAVQAELPDLLR
ncbi:hypothetical protein ABIA33_005086 [Streptacidiphilus sp. MAP12-16]|uniref:hypothetical protein n=1 Tax=Streptacidiphilus sp. MAP12-16 TaxID=3156300 RepID=UPI003513EDE4